MAKIVHTVEELIGNTPLFHLDTCMNALHAILKTI